mgnify:CR=1 FL=1
MLEIAGGDIDFFADRGFDEQKLERKLEAVLGGTVNAAYAVDESLLGGLMVEADGKIMDGSLRRRLREIKDVMNI